MNRKFRWGILGCGQIAGRFADALSFVDEAELWAAGSREYQKGKLFASRYEARESYGSYSELVGDPNIDIIYVATPHSSHFDHSMLALKAGKHVVCEKPLTVNSNQCTQLVAYANEKKLFLMEAVWTRFLPSIRELKRIVRSNTIGEILFVKADFTFPAKHELSRRLVDPELAGGALLDLGIYPANFCHMIFERKPSSIMAMGGIDQGIDNYNMALMDFGEGKAAMIGSSLYSHSSNEAVLTGTKGHIRIPNFWGAQQFIITSKENKETFEFPFDFNGLEYEIKDVHRSIEKGLTHNQIMPLEASSDVISTLDEIRDQIGLKYPFE